MESSFDVGMLGYALPQLIGAVPFLVGLILALTMRVRLGAVATGLTMTACVLGIVGVLISTWWGLWGIRTVYEDFDSPMNAVAAVNVVLGLLHLLWLSLLVAAVFAGRRHAVVVRDAVPAPDSPL
ncbi:hypothetical protein CS0771_21440 [Catellatospora sp. IY07-71]|uniref:hypothetical protein n=1 Tax=Catellatospora sp. IY07-71 TaxID=2728827 RepID=UPI001BB36B6D|nr:hypothetical protein [Catellatospora sp. IY07-71]BCJ72600.1 hypothetical protein CS0771_21440 [Catellatospora sp. IY07-71]